MTDDPSRELERQQIELEETERIYLVTFAVSLAILLAPRRSDRARGGAAASGAEPAALDHGQAAAKPGGDVGSSQHASAFNPSLSSQKHSAGKLCSGRSGDFDTTQCRNQ